MGLFDRISRRIKYFRYDLVVNKGDGKGWVTVAEFTRFISYEDIEPDPGSVVRLYGVSVDKSQKEGVAKKLLWQEKVPSPDGYEGEPSEDGKGKKKEKSIEEKLMEKIVESADFTKLQPAELSVPFGKAGGSLSFKSPVLNPGNPGAGMIKVGDSYYSMGEMPALEFDGKLPSWMHPAAGTMIMQLLDKVGGFVKGAISGGISDATGIKVHDASGGVPAGDGRSGQPPDMVNELDRLLHEDVNVEYVEDNKDVIKEDSNDSNIKVKDKSKSKSKKEVKTDEERNEDIVSSVT
jgi:hypothetical protein